jgi:hypothetical protein
MPDQLAISEGRAVLTTEEGRRLERSESDLTDMLEAQFRLPLDGVALPDGVKFIRWRRPLLVMVHQLPPMVRQLLWIKDGSPRDYGPGTEYRKVRLSMPYVVTFATYYGGDEGLYLLDRNELYFSNQPIRSDQDRLCFPALLNVSRIEAPGRVRSWICTQYLRRPPGSDWSGQLRALLDHIWNGGFNRSSEHHEGQSMYGFSQGVHPKIHPVKRWEKASRDEAFALRVPWKPVPHSIAELMEMMLSEAQTDGQMAAGPLDSLDQHDLFGHHLRRRRSRPNSGGIVAQFLNYVQRISARKAKKGG